MRLNLYWRGRDVIDVEVHVWKRRADDACDDDCGCTGPALESSGNGQFELAEPMEAPDTTVRIGFR